MSHFRTVLRYYTLSQHIITEYAGFSGIRVIVAEPQDDNPYPTDPDTRDESLIEVMVSYDTQIWDENDATPFALMHLTTAGFPDLCLNSTNSWSACFEAPKIHYRFRSRTWGDMAFALEGFLYQIFSPDITNEAFASHVHQVNLNGDSIGATYEYLAKCPGTDNFCFMKTKALRLLYVSKPGRFARGSETLISNLKESVTLEGVQELRRRIIDLPLNWTIVVIGHSLFDVPKLLAYLGELDLDIKYRDIDNNDGMELPGSDSPPKQKL
jgi:hypothetical protein